jgi:hypothetical protein
LGDSATTENKAAEFFNNLIEALLEGGMEAAIVYITGVAPEAMAVPIVSFFVKEALSYAEQFVSVAGQKMATKMVIDVQTHGELSSVLTTATALQIALKDGNSEDQRIAIENAKKSYASLIHFDGSAQPSTS